LEAVAEMQSRLNHNLRLIICKHSELVFKCLQIANAITINQSTNGEKTMSHFYGSIPYSARKTTATARGHKTTGLVTEAASWEGKIVTELHFDTVVKKDMYSIYRKPHGSSGGETILLAQGYLNDDKPIFTATDKSNNKAVA